MNCVFSCLLFTAITFKHAFAISKDQCNGALGMETGRILDSQITASSSFDTESVGPHNARIRVEHDGGAWCPKSQIKQDSEEYIQLDLGSVHVISSIETQGRFGGGLGKEYAPGYKLMYWRDSLNRWVTYNDSHGKQIIIGNTNTFTPVVRELYSPILASSIRLVPWSESQRTVCLRMEIYGCLYRGSMETYSIPQGLHTASFDLRDSSYDGTYDRRKENLMGGLGILHDGVVGKDRAMQHTDKWVGWSTDRQGSSIEIELKLNGLQNISGLSFHCSNQFSNDVYVFANAHLFFSVDGINYSKRIVDYTYLPDQMFETVRWVKIPVPQRLARFIRVELSIYSKYLLLSEIKLHSMIVHEDVNMSNVLDEGAINVEHMPLTVVGGDSHFKRESVAVFTLNQLPHGYIIIIVGVCVLIACLCAILIAVLYLRQRRQHKHELAVYAAAYGGFTTLPHIHNTKAHSLQRVKDMQVLLEASGDINHQVLPSTSTFMMTMNNMENSLLEKLPPCSSPPNCPLPISPPPEYHSQSDESSEYAEPDTPHKSCAEIPLLPPPPKIAHNRRRGTVRTNLAHLSHDNVHYDETTSLHPSLKKISFMQGASGNTIYGSHVEEASTSTIVQEIERDSLVFKEKLGEGEFGEVHLCYLHVANAKSTPVAVKMLREEANGNAVEDFDKELRMLSKLHHPNVVSLIGYCRGNPSCMVVEYVENGDLHHYLRATDKHISQRDLLTMAYQISEGMQYLESMNLIHRDLATRNCLVSVERDIKIADFGMARCLYSSDYYHIDGNFVLPIRWMAWECILLGKFTAKTDVWAYGVTLWEMFTRCLSQPFAHMSDQEVIENIQYMYHSSSLQTYLPAPDDCPTLIYKLMLQCWQKDDVIRPSFQQIGLILHKSLNSL